MARDVVSAKLDIILIDLQYKCNTRKNNNDT